MITITDLQAKVDNLNQVITAEAQQFQEYKTNVESQLAAKDAQIADLQSQLANAPTQDQLTALDNSLTTATEQTGNIIP